MTGYYRRLGYASLVALLTDLLKNDAFECSSAAQQAFDQLKWAMSTTLVLALHDFNETFVLETDTFNCGMGVVLMQKEQPISYFSKKMSLRIQQASAYVRELYAIITKAVKK